MRVNAADASGVQDGLRLPVLRQRDVIGCRCQRVVPGQLSLRLLLEFLVAGGLFDFHVGSLWVGVELHASGAQRVLVGQ